MKKQYKRLTMDDRTLIQVQIQQGFKPGQIAESLTFKTQKCTFKPVTVAD